MEPIEITVACASSEEAATIGRRAVEARLAACAQRWPISSTYRWDGEVVDDDEWLLLLKTTTDHVDAVTQLVTELHSYDLPAISRHAVTAATPGSRAWLVESTSPPA